MSTIRRVLGAAGVVAVVLSAAACDAQQVGAAAVVGDERITVSQLQDKARTIAELPESGLDPHGNLAELQTTILTREITHRVLVRQAEDADIEVSQAEVDDLMEQQTEGVDPADVPALLAQNMFTEDDFRTSAHDNLLVQRLTAALDDDQAAMLDGFNAAAGDLGIEVNPRYGTWSDEAAIDPASGSISRAVDNADGADDAITEAPAQ